jgi:hypothetical protein
VHHAARLGFVVGGDPCVPDHLVARQRKQVNRAIEVVGLVELDLQVEARGRLARPPQPIDVPPIAAVEPRLSNDGPSGHWATA